MHTLYACLTIIAALLIAAIVAIVINGTTVPDGLYISLATIVGGLAGAITTITKPQT
jgi:hypothetical protein